MEIFFEYFKKDHFLSKVDARVKILIGLAVLLMVLSYEGFLFPFFVTFLCFFLCIWMRIPIKNFLLRFSEPFFIVSIIILLKLFFSGKDVLFSINILSINITGYKDGFLEGFMIASRIIGAVSILSVLGFSTPFTEIIAGLSWLRVPKGFIEILMFAHRYIFVLLEDAVVIYNAQRNRLGYSNIWNGLNSFGILSGSLILKAFEQSHNVTVSMIQRGYDGNMPMLKHKSFKFSEIFISILLTVLMAVVWTI